MSQPDPLSEITDEALALPDAEPATALAADAPSMPENLDPELRAYIDEQIKAALAARMDIRWRRLEKAYGRLARATLNPTPVFPEIPATEPGAPSSTGDAPPVLQPGQREGGGDAQGVLAGLARLLAEGQHSAQAVGQAALVPPAGGPARRDLAAEYERRRRALRPGDLNGLLALKREFRAQGLEIF